MRLILREHCIEYCLCIATVWWWLVQTSLGFIFLLLTSPWVCLHYMQSLTIDKHGPLCQQYMAR